jgi:hypothetical protein
VRELASHFAQGGINDINAGWFAGRVSDCVVQREGPTEERVVDIGHAKHKELAGDKAMSDFGTVEPQAVGVACYSHVFQDSYARLAGAIGVELGVKRVAIGDGQN